MIKNLYKHWAWRSLLCQHSIAHNSIFFWGNKKKDHSFCDEMVERKKRESWNCLKGEWRKKISFYHFCAFVFGISFFKCPSGHKNIEIFCNTHKQDLLRHSCIFNTLRLMKIYSTSCQSTRVDSIELIANVWSYMFHTHSMDSIIRVTL